MSNINDLLEKHEDRVKQVTNILVESPYFYRSDDEDTFLFLRRHSEDFKNFFETYFGWILIMDMKCARVYKERWYNNSISPKDRMQFNFSKRDECIAFMLLLRFFEHQLEEQSLTVESKQAPRFRFGDLLEYTRSGFLELQYEEEKYTLEYIRASVLRDMIPVLVKYRFLTKVEPDPGMKIKDDDFIYEAQPALYHYNAGMLRSPLPINELAGEEE